MNPRKKSTLRWKWLAMLTAALSLVVVFACNSPFIPIPPPDPAFAEDSSGEWSVSTAADSRAIGAIYYIFNATLGSGIMQVAAPDGSVYARPLHGQAGDNIHIHWERSTETSSTICRSLGAGLIRMGCQH